MHTIRRDMRTIVVAVVAAAVTAGAPAVAHGVKHALFAHRADNVDGKHAVGSTASASKAAGKLVATGSNGKFATKFLPKVPAAGHADDASTLQGKGPADFQPAGTVRSSWMGVGNGADVSVLQFGGHRFYGTCGSNGGSVGYQNLTGGIVRVIQSGSATLALTHEEVHQMSGPQTPTTMRTDHLDVVHGTTFIRYTVNWTGAAAACEYFAQAVSSAVS
jgi:hypothetical protein